MGSLWNRSGTVERYADDIRAAGAQAFFFAGGTTTPLTVYRDAGESSSHTNPVVADADGRWPDIFVPYTLSYDVQVKTADGVQLTYSLGIPNPNPVDVTVTIPAQNQVQTGMIHGEFVNTVKAGYVRLNGNTIGSAASPANERNNIDTLALYTYLWNIHGPTNNLVFPVIGGRGASAAADFSPGNKALTLPDMRGAALVGLDDMGNVGGAALAFAGLAFTAGGSAIIGGSLTGINKLVLDVTQMPSHFHSGTTAANGGHTHAIVASPGPAFASGTAAAETVAHSHALTGTAGPSGGITSTGVTGAQSQDHTHQIGTGGGTGGAATFSSSFGVAPGGTGINVVGATTINNTGGTSQGHTHSLTGITAGQSATHTHAVSIDTVTAIASTATATSGSTLEANTASHKHGFDTDSKGGLGSPGVTQPFNNLGISRLVTWFIKL